MPNLDLPALVEPRHGAGAGEILVAPAPQPRHVCSLLDPHQAAAAADAMHDSLAASVRLIPSKAGSGGGASRRIGGHEHYRFDPVDRLYTGDVCLVNPRFVQELHELIRGLSDAEALQALRRAFSGAPDDGGRFSRFSDVAGGKWILHAGSEAFADLCQLNIESIKIWAMKLKITAKLFCLIWQEIKGQNWQSSEELKRECFAEFAGKSLENLTEVGRSFSEASWSTRHVSRLLTIFEALVDVLSSIRGLPSNRSDEVAGIFNKMVNAFEGILKVQEDTNDIHTSEEDDTTHQVTDVLIRILNFLHHNRDMVQFIVATGEYTTDLRMIDRWASELKEDARRKFKGKEVRQDIFLLNNTYHVQRMECGPGTFLRNAKELERRFDSLIQQYSKSYLQKCWVPPIQKYLDGSSLKHSSFVKFSDEVSGICRNQAEWKVQPELKCTLRKEIHHLIVEKYRTLSNALPANPSLLIPRWAVRKKKQNRITLVELEEVIAGLFECP